MGFMQEEVHKMSKEHVELADIMQKEVNGLRATTKAMYNALKLGDSNANPGASAAVTAGAAAAAAAAGAAAAVMTRTNRHRESARMRTSRFSRRSPAARHGRSRSVASRRPALRSSKQR